MYWKPALQRIKQYNPQMKWIFILRNPIERAYSHYIAARKLDFENLKFEKPAMAIVYIIAILISVYLLIKDFKKKSDLK